MNYLGVRNDGFNMILIVRRKVSDGVATLGELFINGQHECFTLEPSMPILAGTYNLTIDWSPRFQRLMPHVNTVPGHEGIRIHWGNWTKDTEDCLLVGTTLGTDFIGHSVEEFDRLFIKLQDALMLGPCSITYLDGVV
jgi:hypothetical protein